MPTNGKYLRSTPSSSPRIARTMLTFESRAMLRFLLDLFSRPPPQALWDGWLQLWLERPTSEPRFLLRFLLDISHSPMYPSSPSSNILRVHHQTSLRSAARLLRQPSQSRIPPSPLSPLLHLLLLLYIYISSTISAPISTSSTSITI